MKILYVDDDPDIRDVAELSLQMDPDFDVRVAASGQEALDILGGWPAELLVMDWMMPQMDGPALLAAVRARTDIPQPRAIFITARALPNELAHLTTLDIDGVVTKPFNPMTLAQEIRRMLAR